jgi:hypothetical protein
MLHPVRGSEIGYKPALDQPARDLLPVSRIPLDPLRQMLARRQPVPFRVIALVVRQDEIVPEIDRIPRPRHEMIDVRIARVSAERQ